MKIAKNNLILELDNSDTSFELSERNLTIDFDNIKQEGLIAPLVLYKLSSLKTELEYELIKAEKSLERSFYEYCRGKRLTKASFPNNNNSLSASYPQNNQQVLELVYTDKGYVEKSEKLEKQRYELQMVKSYYYAYTDKVKKIEILLKK